MRNIIHYIKGIISGDEFYTLDKKLRFISVTLAIFHIVLAIISFFAEVFPLMLYNSAAFFFFTVIMLNLVKKQNYTAVAVLSICEVALSAFFSTLCVGLDAGFNAYDVALITACFYLTFVISTFQNKEFIPFILSMLAVCCYMLNYIISLFIEPFYVISNPVWIRTFFILNHLISFMMMIVFSFLLVWELRLSNNKLKLKNEELDELAHKDPLTKLYNRRSMNNFLNESLDNLKLRGRRFSLILGDIDDFKKVNDTYGHDAGDAVLVAVANIISNSVSNTDYVCRWGGEEILVLINEPVETAIITADKIKRKIETTSVKSGDTEIRVTMTLGISESIPGYKLEHLIQQADDKLYIGKKNGKNQVVV